MAGRLVLAAPPPDVRKGFAFPRALEIFRAAPDFSFG
jgi:hypothetical protein